MIDWIRNASGLVFSNGVVFPNTQRHLSAEVRECGI